MSDPTCPKCGSTSFIKQPAEPGGPMANRCRGACGELWDDTDLTGERNAYLVAQYHPTASEGQSEPAAPAAANDEQAAAGEAAATIEPTAAA